MLDIWINSKYTLCSKEKKPKKRHACQPNPIAKKKKKKKKKTVITSRDS